MTLRLKILLILLLVAVGASVFRHLGGRIWRPALTEYQGGKSVEGVVAGLSPKGKGLSDEEVKSLAKLTLIALKKERVLELWGKHKDGRTQKIRSYQFYGFSGREGPKLEEGDFQIPEGLYRIEYLNPNSDFHLSIKIDYPNSFDRAKARLEGRDFPGTDIFIHGRDATIGCVPIGDQGIEDLFMIVAQMGIKNVNAIFAPHDFRTDPAYPEIDSVEWEDELYDLIAKEMKKFQES